jgi:hypothetical protein
MGAGQHAGTMRTRILDSSEKAPRKPIFAQVLMRVHPLSLPAFRADLIAEVSASDTEPHRYGCDTYGMRGMQ